MPDLSAIRVIPFYGKSNEWPTLNKKFLANAKGYGFKDILSGRSIIPKTNEALMLNRKKKRRR
jgi:hypothetical protein